MVLLRTDKREAILRGARTVFAREGYVRASIDAIAAAAGVSTRTIYKHFGDKATLFGAVVEASATRAAEAQLAMVERHLVDPDDLETALVGFGLELADPDGRDAEHFALVRQITADPRHTPAAAIDAWQEAGPLRVRRELGARLAALLPVEDPERAALHLMVLVTAANPSLPRPVADPAERERMVRAGVRVFLHGSLP